MPLITTVHESLPYIDPDPTPAEREAAEALIAAERLLVPDDPHHALLPALLTPSFSAAMQAELERVATKQPLKAIDLSRYEAQEPLDDVLKASNGTTNGGDDGPRARLAAALARAYASATYLRGRRAHLALLDRYGKNAWLVGNWQLEAELRAVEAELAARRQEIELLALKRRQAQEEVSGEMRGLEEAWRKGVGKVLETEVAAEGLRQEVLEQRRRLG